MVAPSHGSLTRLIQSSMTTSCLTLQWLALRLDSGDLSAIDTPEKAPSNNRVMRGFQAETQMDIINIHKH